MLGHVEDLIQPFPAFCRDSLQVKQRTFLRDKWLQLSFDEIAASFTFPNVTLFWGAPKSLQMVIAAIKLKDAYSLEGKL